MPASSGRTDRHRLNLGGDREYWPNQMYLDKNRPSGQKTWEDFVKYCDDDGVSWLLHQDLYENFRDGTKDKR